MQFVVFEHDIQFEGHLEQDPVVKSRYVVAHEVHLVAFKHVLHPVEQTIQALADR